MERISVVGISGSGKTTMTKAISDALDCPSLELDSLYHQADWKPLPTAEFQAAVRAFTVGETWVVDGRYGSMGISDIVWSRADTVVWMDLPKRTVMRRVAWRSATRAAAGTELWNGNTERWSNLLKWDPEDNILRWAWTQYETVQRTYEQAMAAPRWSHLTFHRLATRSDVDSFLSRIS